MVARRRHQPSQEARLRLIRRLPVEAAVTSVTMQATLALVMALVMVAVMVTVVVMAVTSVTRATPAAG